MAVRCSLLGHNFGATEVERQREERGSEVVVTVVEYEACTRCGNRNVISENTEVKRIEPDEPAEAAGDADAVEAGPEAGTAAPTETESTDGADESSVPTDENGDPITDDAEILDETEPADAADDGDRERGAWPEADDVGRPDTDDADSAEWPDADADEDGGAELIDAADASTGAEESSGDAADAPDPAPSESATGSGIERAGAAPTPGETSPRDDVPVEFFCPRCSFVAADDRGSLRAGDICPECKKGYLSERER